MKALTLWQPWASLVAVGAKTIETRSWSTSYRGPLAVHAAARPPAGKEYDPGARPRVGDWKIERLRGPSGIEWAIETPLGPPGLIQRFPLPLGAIVATCTLTDVVPIIDRCGTDMLAPAHVCRSGDALLHHAPADNPFPDGETEHIVTDQLPYGDFTPGRYAWLLDDIEPTTERCPACWGAGRRHLTVPGVPRKVCDASEPCPVCWPRETDGSRKFWRDETVGRCEPIPARGRQGLWNWEPA